MRFRLLKKVALALLLAIESRAASAQKIANSDQVTPASQTWVDTVVSQNEASVVFIRARVIRQNGMNDVRTGTGFIISSEGMILTCNHLIPAAEESKGERLELRGSVGGRELQAFQLSIVEPVPARDLCVLKLPHKPGNWPCVQAVGRPKLNAEVVALGFPEGADFTPARGWITTKNGEAGKWGTNANLNPGLSGGPVFDATMKVVAIVAGGRRHASGLNEVIPITFARDLLQRYGSTPAPPREESSDARKRKVDRSSPPPSVKQHTEGDNSPAINIGGDSNAPIEINRKPKRK